MAEIGTSTSSATWAPASSVRSTTDAKQPAKRDQKKYNQQKNQQRDKTKQNLKKQPPGSGINSHIDEYA